MGNGAKISSVVTDFLSAVARVFFLAGAGGASAGAGWIAGWTQPLWRLSLISGLLGTGTLGRFGGFFSAFAWAACLFPGCPGSSGLLGTGTLAALAASFSAFICAVVVGPPPLGSNLFNRAGSAAWAASA